MEELARSDPFRRYVGAMGEYLRDLAEGSENVEYVPDLVTFPADQMQNSDHVIHPAARRYSVVVASRVSDGFRPRTGGIAEPPAVGG